MRRVEARDERHLGMAFGSKFTVLMSLRFELMQRQSRQTFSLSIACPGEQCPHLGKQ